MTATFSFGQMVHDNAVVIVGVVAAASLLYNVLLKRRIARLNKRLTESRAAAEESARLAALAHPGGIDPEAVIEVLRRGIPPTLDNVYSVMRRRDQLRDQEREPNEAITSSSRS
jgi:hypothetical protein